MYTQPLLAELLDKQSQSRGQSKLFKKGTITIQWRAKVGSFPHPDGETIVSAGEPCGPWKPNNTRPEDKRNVSENWEQLDTLPLHGYIPGSSIRGLVRAWAKKNPAETARMRELLGYQDEDKNLISPGKIEFLDAYPHEATQLTLDIVNPQQEFQVFHQGQSTPLSFYALGNGEDIIPVTIAIRGIPNKATPEDVEKVWEWVEQALCFYGVGSRTASGYGAIKKKDVNVTLPDGYSLKELSFALYSQGCYGANQSRGYEELRPSHWRGWLRSWVLRFLLGVMSVENAHRTLGELLGTIGADDNAKAIQGCVRIKMKRGKTWGESSYDQPRFYVWKGKLEISAPSDILNDIILPIVQFAASVGGVGRGWRRPLHIFMMTIKDKKDRTKEREEKAARGSYLNLIHRVESKKTKETRKELYAFHPNKINTWQTEYQKWLDSVQAKWPNRFEVGVNNHLAAEVFSPSTCAVYTVPAPVQEPINFKQLGWNIPQPLDTRGDGMNLVYQQQSPRNYKRNRDLGGNAGNGGAYCSWVSIRRVNIPHKEEDTDCQETVCLFLGGVNPDNNSDHVRSHFLRDLANISGSTYLFGFKG
ncbi:MAG: RAMP superfamily CRISPR-associated protein [Halothece sp.]